MLSSKAQMVFTHNNLKCFQVNLEWMMQDYTKMEEFSMQQQINITDLEQTCQKFRK
jgi:hypothetical protein